MHRIVRTTLLAGLTGALSVSVAWAGVGLVPVPTPPALPEGVTAPLGGNGILLDHDVARFFNDAEALYSYEGTREINTLVVGRAITGHGAFV